MVLTCKDWNLESIVTSSENFFHIPRISASESGTNVMKKIKEHEQNGVPLVIEGFSNLQSWPTQVFDLDNLVDNWHCEKGTKVTTMAVRNIHNWTDREMPTKEFVKVSRSASRFWVDGEQERLYGKDAKCPSSFHTWLHSIPCAIPRTLIPEQPENYLRRLPEEDRVETIMCYLGIGDTYTPCHKDLCGSTGQNLMCYTEQGGSSYWFMTKTSDASEVTRYFKSKNHEIDHENYAMTLEEFRLAPFNVYITEQTLGDLVIVPPRSCHQVVNYGGLTVKTAWSRMTLDGLQLAYHYELPIYRRVCRPETYRVKSIIFHSLSQLISEAKPNEGQTLQFKSLLELYELIFLEESPPSSSDALVTLNSSSAITCDFCACDIFQSFFECHNCLSSSAAESAVICSGCYIEGRTCRCRRMTPTQIRPPEELEDVLVKARKILGDAEYGDLTPTDDFQIRVFTAACILEQRRRSTNYLKSSLTCRVSYKGDKNHTEESASAISCPGCHSAKCFEHILTIFKMHTVEVMNWAVNKKAGDKYHQRHKESREQYPSDVDRLLKDEVSGKPPNVTIQRVYLAQTFPLCRPHAAHVVPGFYDKNIENTYTSEREVVLWQSPEPQATAYPPSPSPSTDEDSFSDYANSKKRKASRRKPSSGRKRERRHTGISDIDASSSIDMGQVRKKPRFSAPALIPSSTETTESQIDLHAHCNEIVENLRNDVSRKDEEIKDLQRQLQNIKHAGWKERMQSVRGTQSGTV